MVGGTTGSLGGGAPGGTQLGDEHVVVVVCAGATTVVVAVVVAGEHFPLTHVVVGGVVGTVVTGGVVGLGPGGVSVLPGGTGGFPWTTGLPHLAMIQIFVPSGSSIRIADLSPSIPAVMALTTWPESTPELTPSAGA